MDVGISGEVLVLRNDVIFAVESTLMIVDILITSLVLVFLIWHRGRETRLSVDDLEKLEGRKKCP